MPQKNDHSINPIANTANLAQSVATPIATPIATPKTVQRRIKSISLEFTSDQSNATKLDLLWDAVESQGELSKADRDLMDKLGEIVDAEEKENSDRILKESEAKKTAFIESSKALTAESEASHAQTMQNIKIESQAKIKHLAPLTEQEEQAAIDLKARQLTDTLNTQLSEALEVKKNAVKKRHQVKLEKMALQESSSIPSRPILTEAARQLMPGQSIDLQTTNHGGQEVTIEAVTVL